MMRVLITGATGFVGRALCTRMLSGRFQVSGTLLQSESASSASSLLADVSPFMVDPIGPETIWSDLGGIDTIVHLAARVHIMRDTSVDPLAAFRHTNTAGTVRLATKAALAGVRRFVFMSTIGVNGDNSGTGSYAEADDPHPHNSYSVSKYEAEQALWQISCETGMEIVIIRAPLVYGPGNPGNFLSLLKIVSKGIPLPFASVSNKRSLIYVGNLVHALATCATHPDAAGNLYLVSDGEDCSTPELISSLAKSLGLPVKMFPFPPALIRLAGSVAGKASAANGLVGSLMVDSTKIRQELGWHPIFTKDEGLKETALWFKRVYS